MVALSPATVVLTTFTSAIRAGEEPPNFASRRASEVPSATFGAAMADALAKSPDWRAVRYAWATLSALYTDLFVASTAHHPPPPSASSTTTTAAMMIGLRDRDPVVPPALLACGTIVVTGCCNVGCSVPGACHAAFCAPACHTGAEAASDTPTHGGVSAA